MTIIETLVAISILLIALAGPLTISANGLESSLYGRDQITASYLAQEGIEYVRNVRDTDTLTGASSWVSNLAPCISSNGSMQYCNINTYIGDPTSAIRLCSGQVCPPLLLDSNTDLYQYTAGVASKFTRTITLVPVMKDSSGNWIEYDVISKVVWTSPLPNNVVTLSEDIYNWQQ